MLFDSLHQPAGLLSDCPIFGNARHGLCVENTLTLPNGSTVFVSSPFGQFSDSYAIRLQGVPDVVRTPEQAALDFTDGLVWTADVILPGPNRTTWLWKNTAGRVFQIEIREVFPLTSVVVRVRPWGDIGGEPETPRDSTFTGFTVAEEASLWRIWDLNADGSAALIARRTGTPFDPPPTLHNKMIGLSIVATVTLSQGLDGWPSPSVSVTRTNEQCLGTISSAFTEGSPAPTLVSWREYVGEELGPFQISEAGAGIPPLGAVLEEFAKNGVETGTTSFTLSDRLLSCWYGSGGAVQYLTLTLQRDEIGTRTHVHTASGTTRTISDDSLLDYTSAATYTYAGTALLNEAWADITDSVGSNPTFPFGMQPNWNGVAVSTMTSTRYQMYLPQLNQATAQTFGLVAFSKKIFAPFHASSGTGFSTGGTYTFEPARHPGGTTPSAPSPVTVLAYGPFPVFVAQHPRTGALTSWSAVPVGFI
jgi:hypothetical protein